MKRVLLLTIFVLTTVTAEAGWWSERLLARAWPETQNVRLEDLGTGVGVVFTPDLSVPGNCRFYTALGFACFESADWLRVLGEINEYNIANPDRRVRTLILETHGTNGNGLKLQKGKKPDDERSYIAVAALQEMLEPVGVRYVIISACNSGRLLRPEIYRRLNREPGDPLFLPATLGIVDASDFFDPRRSKVEVITPGASQIETTLVGAISELAPSTRKELARAAKLRGVKLPEKFAVSEMLIQMLLRDSKLSLRTGAHVDDLSKAQTSAKESEQFFTSFVAHLDFTAARDASPAMLTGAR